MDKDKILKKLPLILFILFIVLPNLGKNGIILLLIIGLAIFVVYNLKNKKLSDPIGMKNAIDLDKINFMQNVKRTMFLILAVFFGFWLFFASIYIVDAGETGVYSLFGKVSDQELKSGFHLVIPLANVTRMSIRTEEYTMSKASNEGKKTGDDSISVLTKEGLEVKLDITTFFHLEEDKASDIYKNVGIGYEEKIVRPEIRSTIREVVAQYDAKEMYSDKREEINDKIFTLLRDKLQKRGIVVEDTLLRDVTLPSNLAQSIQEKLQAEQEAQKYDFLVAKERKEKERKVIEAEGQRDSQKIINESLSNNYLYFLYIKELKDRQGTIYVPTNPATGMPLFRDLGK